MVNLDQNRRNQNVGLESEKPKPINSQDMAKYGDMDLFLMQKAATGKIYILDQQNQRRVGPN